MKEMTVTICADSYLAGGRWGYLKESAPSFSEIVSEVEREGGTILEVENGVVVLSDESELSEAVRMVDAGLPDKRRKKRIEVEQNRFLKFLEKAVMGKDCYGQKLNGGVVYHIGLYSNTERPEIRTNGKSYPSFCMTVDEVLLQLRKGLRFREIYIKMDKGFTALESINEADSLEVLGNMEISDTGTGVFLCIRLGGKV